ncbi:T9SS type A sorting domain-containing protein [Bernardetia sp.]|uniref:T9SS type A sorting domain-containing protein n=1 Tax=Bernardetia sp. TaxID=1937974 RepID=UPI0025C32394|nr:T9SS type A sorting domain-containing protein [Bernardetia sp.]
MKSVILFIFLMLLPFSIYAQFTGGDGGGSAKAEIRKQTVLSLEEEQKKAFFENLKVITQKDIVYIKWNDKVKIEYIEIIDVLGKKLNTVYVSDFKNEIKIPFIETKGVYFIRFKSNKEQFFTKKMAY